VLAAARENVPLPTIIELLLLLVLFEIIREAGVHTPSGIGSAVTIGGTLVVPARRHILWAPSLIVLIGQAAAQHGIAPILDTLSHEPWFRPTIAVLITHGDVRALLGKRQSGPETSVSRSLKLLEESTHFDESTAWAPRLFDVVRMDAEQGRSILIPALSTTNLAYPQGRRRTPSRTAQSSSTTASSAGWPATRCAWCCG
jgi:hypothetical protein